MASQLSAILTPEEYDSLSSVLKEKIDDCLSKKEADLSKTKIQFAKFQSESDQKFYDLDVELKRFQQQNQKEADEKNELVQQKNDIESKFNEINEELLTLQQNIALLEEANSGLKRDKETLMTERDDFVSLLSRKNDDVDRLTTELKSLTDQLMNANREKSEVMIKSEELSSKQLALDYKEKRLDQERELMTKQLKVLQDELDGKTKEIVTMRREKTSKVLELQADLSEKIEELKISQRSIEEMRKTIEQQEKQIKELTGKVKDLNEAEHKMSENARNELRSQMRLCELYKASSEDAQCKADELSKGVEELQRLLRDASVRYGELETETKSEIESLKEHLKKRDEAIDEMKKELDRANGLLDTSKSRLLTEESIEAMSPSAAAASRLLKSGMTLTQIYSQYVTVSEQLLVKEEENKKLNNYIDQILQEIEERAPIISRQREDYEKSIEMVSNLTRQLDLAIEEAEKEKCDALEARRLLGQSQRTNQRLEKQVTDLSKQVSFLLREVEELRGNKMADGPSNEQNVVSSTEDGSAAAIISRHLVTFKDVEELQHRNQMLLNTLREVTEKQEDAEREVLTEKTAKIEQALEKALMEVENMREARRRQEEIVQSIVQQRDMYRMMAQEAGFNESRSPSKFSSVAMTSTPAAATRTDRSFDSAELNEVKVRLETSESNYKALVQEKKELERNLNDKIQKLNDSVADLRAQNVRLGTQIEYSNEKEKLLMGNIEGFKKQISALEDKNKMYACTVAKHEQSIAVLRDEAMSAQQQLARSEVTVSLLQQEKELLKSAEQRLLIERDSLISEKRSQILLHVNLESIKLNLERGESETRTRLQNTVTSLEQQIELLRKKLDGEEHRYKETVQSFEERLEQEKSLLSKSEEKVKELEEKLSQAPSTGSIVQMTDDETVKSLRNQLIESKTELTTLRNQLELSKQQVDQYKEIANRIEEELKRNNEASIMFREETERKVKELNEEKENLMKKLEESDEKFKKLEAASQKLDETEQLTRQVSNLTSEIERLTAQVKSAEESEQRARFDYFEQSKQAKEAQDRYERELVQHAADIEQLNRTREQVDLIMKELNDLKQSRAQVEQELDSGKKSWTDQKEMLEKELKEKSERCNELEKQVDLTQQQIVSLSTRMAALTKIQETPLKSDDLNVSMEEERTSDQLLELVRFLRREKEIAISRSEVQEAENQRIKTQLEIAEKQLNEVQKSLDAERERLATSSLTFEKHTEMLRRLETLNALTDSNRLLREEKVNLTSGLEELTVKCRDLQSELEPLKSLGSETSAKVDELTNENVALRKQVMVWKSRVNSLQERAGNANETKRLQLEKENLQKQIEMLTKLIEANKEMISKLNSQVSEAGKLQDENNKFKEEIEKLKGTIKENETKKAEESAKSIEQANQLRRIARKYKTQYEESKAELDKLKESGPPEAVVDTTKVQELEQKINELTAEVEAVKSENTTLKANDEKTKNLLKTMRQKFAAFNALTKEKESLTIELTEAKSKIESLEQGNEEMNVRSAALKSQLEGRLSRLERENGELVQVKQSLESQIEVLNQKITIAQRQLDVYQKTVVAAPVKATVAAEVAETPTANVKPIPTETPTAEIKPMAGQVKSTPRASIRPMAATRTAAVQPMAVVVAVREEEAPEPVQDIEPVAGPSSEPSSVEPRQQKRSRDETDQEEEDEDVKRTRVNEEEEEGEVLELMAPEEGAEEGTEEFVDEGQEEGEDETVEDEAEEVDNEPIESEPMNEEEGEVVEVEEETSETMVEEQQQQPEEVNEPVVEEVENQPPPIEEEPEEAPHQVPQEPTPTPAVILPPPRENLLPPIPRPTIAYDDGGDDGIVPSTPVLLPPRANDGFAEAVSSPQVTTRFVFGSVVEAPSASHLESQGMEDTRMDLSQLDENRVPPVAEETPAPSVDEPADLEGGPDLEGDAAAEMDLLREDEAGEGIHQETQQESRVEPEPSTGGLPPPPVQRIQSPRGGGTARRASPRGRGMLNRPPGPSRPVPITWTPTGQSNVIRENNPRVFRRAATTSPAGATGLLPDPVVGTPSPVRGRGAAAGRGRARRAARRP